MLGKSDTGFRGAYKNRELRDQMNESASQIAMQMQQGGLGRAQKGDANEAAFEMMQSQNFPAGQRHYK